MGDSFESREEASAYHQGYKDGLDERFGVRDEMPAATMPGMASQELHFADEERLDELSPELLGRAYNKSMGLARQAVGSDPSTPFGRESDEEKFHKARANKFSAGIKKALDRDEEKIRAAGQAERMSPAAMRKMKQMQGMDEELEVEEGMMDKARGLNYKRLAQRSMNKAANAMDKASDFDFSDLDNREEHEDEFMKQMDKRRQRAKKASELLGYDIDADEVFEAWDNELKSLLKEDDSETVNEGLSVSISKGQAHSPDSVSVTAQDGEAEELLKLVKHMSGGLFGGEQEVSDYGAPKADQPVDDHDQMMTLMKAVSHDDEGCDSGCDMYEEESEDQMEFEVAEDNQPDTGAKDSVADEEAEAQEDQALAGAMSGKETEINEEDHASVLEFLNSLDEDDMVMADKDDALDEADMEEGNEFTEKLASTEPGDSFELDGKTYKNTSSLEEGVEGLNEWANDAGRDGTDEAFQQDIDFMTKVISGGLNKQKKDQTTLPHTKVKVDGESPEDWMKLAGIKK